MTTVEGSKVTVEEASIFATDVYLIDSQKRIITDDIPIDFPEGWIPATWTNATELSLNGFVAQIYQNIGAKDYVISFRGTDNLADWPFQNAGMIASALATQNSSALYFTARAIQQIAAENNWSLDEARAHITFTGHSLGGGLANIMAALFDRPAIVFDPAPTIGNEEAKDVQKGGVFISGPLLSMANTLNFPGMPPWQSINEEGRELELFNRAKGNTSSFSLRGEVLSLLDPIGFAPNKSDIDIDVGGSSLTDFVDLHSMSMLALALKHETEGRSFSEFCQSFSILTTNLLNSNYSGIMNSKGDYDRDILLRMMYNDDALYSQFILDFTKLKGLFAFSSDGREVHPMGEPLLQASLIAFHQYAQDKRTGPSLGQDTGTVTFDWHAMLTKAALADGIGNPNTKNIEFLNYFSYLAKLTALISTTDNVNDSDITGKIYDTYHFASDIKSSNATGNEGSDLYIGGIKSDIFHAGKGDDVVVDSGADASSNNQFYGEDGNDILVGGAGNDLLHGGTGADKIFGGIGNDTLIANQDQIADKLYGGDGDDVIYARAAVDAANTIDGGKGTNKLYYQAATEDTRLHRDTISNFDSIITKADPNSNGKAFIQARIENVHNWTLDENVAYTVDITGTAAGGFTLITDDKDDTFLSLPKGTVVYTGGGKDNVQISNNIYVLDVTADDKMTFMGMDLHGGTRRVGDEDPWAYGQSSVGYGRNQQGDLVLKSPLRNADGSDALTFVANYTDDGGGKGRTAGILMLEIQAGAFRLLEEKPQWAQNGINAIEAYLGWISKTYSGNSYYKNVDPLVLDLDGDGIELTARSTLAPSFDVDGDKFAERTGWVGKDDGLLARDLNANGKIDGIGELFGSATQTGFAALAALDLNKDGVINATDAAFSTLRIWRDLNGNGVTDAGELQTLTAAGIKSIGVKALSTASSDNAGNTITGTGTFTKTNGTTGTVADVQLLADQKNTIWLGSNAISATAAALPDVKGFGTLPDLRVAMTLSPSLATLVTSALPGLSSFDMETLRVKALPILNAWAGSVALPVGASGTSARPDMPVQVKSSISGSEVLDFAYQVSDANGSYWKMGSGEILKDATGAAILRPTLAQVMAQPETTGSWQTLKGDYIKFAERYLGIDLPITGLAATPQTGGLAVNAANGLVNTVWNISNEMALRIAMQGPLSKYFAGIAYDKAEDDFNFTTDRGLVPMFEAILKGAPTSGADAYLQTWKTVLDVFLWDVDRGENFLDVTYGWLAQNLIAAIENTGTSISLVKAAAALDIPTDLIRQGTGTVVGGDDADIFYLGAGNQIAKGGIGPDTYIVGKNFGNDVIDDLEGMGGNQAHDYLRFAQLTSDQLYFTRDGLDLVITQVGTTNQIRVLEQFIGEYPSLNGANLNNDRGVNEIIFANGKVWSKIDIAYAVSHPDAASKDVIGTPDVDVLDGGAGNDRLQGGDDGDIYIFGRNYGNDIISEGQNNVLINTLDILSIKGDVSSDDVHFGRQGASNDLIITIAGDTGSLTVEGQFDATYTGPFGTQWLSRIEAFAFADGVSYTWSDLFSVIVNQARTGGNDEIYGFSWQDTLDGGAGDDLLVGGNENDTYIFGLGYGHDIIWDQGTNIYSGHDDVLRIVGDVLPQDVKVSRSGGSLDMLLELKDGSTATIKGAFDVFDTGPFGLREFDRIEQIKFSNGVTWSYEDLMAKVIANASTSANDLLYGFDHRDDLLSSAEGNDILVGLQGNDTLIGGKGNDILVGGWDNDTYVFNKGDGQDIISDYNTTYGGGWGGNDTIQFGAGITAANLVVSQANNGNDLILALSGTTDKITITGGIGGGSDNRIELIKFADGSSTTYEALYAKTIIATAGADTFYGDERDNVLSGAAGNDLLSGQSGNDTLSGGLGNDVLVGGRDNDVLTGGTGNDLLNGGGGDDTYVFNKGDGQDIISDCHTDYGWYANGWGGNDTILFGAGITAANLVVSQGNNGNDLIVALSGTTDKITIAGGINGGGDYFIEQAKFADGTSLAYSALFDKSVIATAGADTFYGDNRANILSGGAGNDTLIGRDGNDTLTGGTGNDLLIGGGGDDVYVFNKGDGQDIISDFHNDYGGLWNGWGGNDTIQFGAGITAANLQISQANLGRDLVIALSGTTDKITIAGGVNGFNDYRIEQLKFADNSVMSFSALFAKSLVATSGNDTRYGNEFDNVISGLAGNDTLYSMNGNDTISGGTGNDRLLGGSGDDTYLFNLGDGQDTIEEEGYWSGPGDMDTLKFGAGITAANLVVKNANYGQGLELSVAGTTDKITLAMDLVNTQTRLETVVLSDGTTFTHNQLLSRIGTTGADTIYGDEQDNVLNGLAGNDTFIGRGGNDVLNGGDGTDTVNYSDTWYGVLVNLSATTQTLNGMTLLAGTASDGFQRTDTLISIEKIIGTDKWDWMMGSANADILQGWGGNDWLNGGAGNDTLYGGWGDDVLIGGDGVDTLDYSPAGSAGILANLSTVAQTLNGYVVNASTVTDGMGGVDTVSTIESIIGTVTHDWMFGSVNADTFSGGDGNDWLNGDAGNDTLGGGAGNDTLLGGAGTDTASYASSTAGILLNLSAASQTLNGVTVTALTVRDGLGGIDTLSSIEIVSGSNYNDWMFGSVNADTFSGNAGNDWLNGDAGNDTLAGGAGNDTLLGGAGTDTASYSSSTAGILVNLSTASQTLNGVAVTASTARDGLGGIDTLASIETIWGSNLNDWMFGSANADTFSGNAGNDWLNGDAGNDTLAGGAGNDTLLGGAGIDTASYTSSTASVLVNLSSASQTLNGIAVAASTARDGLGGIDTLASIESVWGSNLNDWMFGTINADTMSGGAGNDNLNGDAGNDYINGGVGSDVLNGGAGVDTVAFSSATSRVLVNIDTAAHTLNAVSVAAGTARDGATDVDTLFNFENVTGSAYNDFIYGNAGANTLNGSSGNDWLFGGAGADIFQYSTGGGSDTIADFTNGSDRLQLVGTGATAFSALALADTANGATVSYGGQLIFTLTGVTKSVLDTSDFLFA